MTVGFAMELRSMCALLALATGGSVVGLYAAPASHAAQAPDRGEPPAVGCDAETGPYQWQLEEKLGLPQDGRMSEEDCLAIKELQERIGTTPVNGAADLRTYRMLLVFEVRENPNAAKECPVKSYRVTCVDLTRQILWVQKGDKVIFAPVPVRSGRPGLETRTGWQRIYQKNETFFSTIYDNAPMPYSQFFNGGQALHGTEVDLFQSGSAGCVNMYVKDAKRLFELLDIGDQLYIYGRKQPTRALESTTTKNDDQLVREGFGSDGIPALDPQQVD
ncbi:L,D-transpeptidase [Streptomyces sp. NPDC057496]|uniref:L,D-transpeptidase n=1 Tax=Streptomyces sp. NPDC057496 TaxID=3346149 RepID=UPI003683AD63